MTTRGAISRRVVLKIKLLLSNFEMEVDSAFRSVFYLTHIKYYDILI